MQYNIYALLYIARGYLKHAYNYKYYEAQLAAGKSFDPGQFALYLGYQSSSQSSIASACDMVNADVQALLSVTKSLIRNEMRTGYTALISPKSTETLRQLITKH